MIVIEAGRLWGGKSRTLNSTASQTTVRTTHGAFFLLRSAENHGEVKPELIHTDRNSSDSYWPFFSKTEILAAQMTITPSTCTSFSQSTRRDYA